jgi:hypothetical protein
LIHLPPGRWLIAGRSVLGALLLLALPSGGGACSVPVFRYALEHWSGQQYEAVVLHRGPLPGNMARSVRALEEAPANLTVIAMEAGRAPPELLKVWGSGDPQRSAPWLFLRRGSGLERALVWSGPLTEESCRALLSSPTRQELVRRLTGGDSVVFLLLTCGREEEDNAALQFLEQQLPRLQQELRLPEHAFDDAALRSPVPLKLALSVLPLSCTAAGEGPFVHMLQHVEGLERPSGPIMFPIFGRGRALAGLPVADVDSEVLRRTTTFLCGACSCELKEGNPGIDLLLSADWEALLGLAGEEKQPPRQAPPVAVSAGNPSPRSHPPWLYAAILGAGLLVILTGARVLGNRKPQSPE